MEKLNATWGVPEVFSLLQRKKNRWTPAEDFTGLPGYTDIEGKEQPFLSALILTGLCLPPEPERDSISFSAIMEKASAPFLRDTLCFDGMGDRIDVTCRMDWDKYGEIRFSVSCRFDDYRIAISNLALFAVSLTFTSGMSAETLGDPHFSYHCVLAGQKQPVTFFINASPGNRRLSLYAANTGCGEMGSCKIDEILSLLQMDVSQFRFTELLPECLKNELFDNLEIQNISMEAEGAAVYSLGLNLCSKAAWKMMEGVFVTPDFRIQIFFPYDDVKRSLYLSVAGDWRLGKTVYRIYADPFMGEFSLRMKEGQILDFESIAALFLKTDLPDIKIDTLSASINFKSGKKSFQMQAKDIWRFSILNKNFGVERVALKVWLEADAYDVVIQGDFLFLDVLLTLSCRFRGDDSYYFNAGPADDTKIKLTAYVREFFDSTSVDSYIPKEFLDFNIHHLELSYRKEKGSNQFDFNAKIENVLSITDKFAIDTFYVSTRIKDSKTEFIRLRAEFVIVDCGFYLEVEKKENSFCLAGGTRGDQKIPVGKLLESFLEALLDYHVALPKSLSSFTIRHIGFSYSNEVDRKEFQLDCTASFEGDDDILGVLFSSETHIVIDAVKSKNKWGYKFQISCRITLNENQILTCGYSYDGIETKGRNEISIQYAAKNPGDEITFGEILTAIGFTGIDESWAFLTKTGITRAEITYEFIKSEFSAVLQISGGGSLQLNFTCGEHFEFYVSMLSKSVISLTELPVAGGLVKKFNPSPEKFSVSDISFYALSPLYAAGEMKAGVRLALKVCGEAKALQIYEMPPPKQKLLAGNESSQPPKTFWVKIEKTIAVFTLHRMGVALAGSELGLFVDASLNVAPLTFDMIGLGILADISSFDKVSFALSGLGISLQTSALSLTGAFMRSTGEHGGADIYSGCLAIRAGNISAFAVGQYSDGALLAYACVNVPLGGPPAFFVKGFAAGFGYNEAITLPSIEQVSTYPLIAGAMGTVSQEELPGKLSEYIKPCSGQFFIAAGVHFSSFEIADSFALVTVSFGKKLQVGLLGLSDMTMPPKCDKTPVAHAQLALRAAFLPDDGLFCVEALLTSESYVLSKDCKLTGGFAFYLWFGKEHSGDFVITLGGYHPAFAKPEHYPVVPRLGFHWDVISGHPGRLVISGEMYFALTPSAIMAGGRLSAVYADGNLRAWFIARADFLICWKPFHYDIGIGISLGASYKLNLLFVQCTFKIELGCDLHIWGPDFSGTARISWFIISFTIRFGADAGQEPKKINWTEFAESFLPEDKSHVKKNGQKTSQADGMKVNPLSTMISGGMIGQLEMPGNPEEQDGIPIVCPEQFEFTFMTVFPCMEAKIKTPEKEKILRAKTADLFVRPMDAAVKASALELEIVCCGLDGKQEKRVNIASEPVKKSIPSALWGQKDDKAELVPDTLCGVTCIVEPVTSPLFPKNCFISEEMLSSINAIIKENAFDFSKTWKLPEYETGRTVHYVTETAFKLQTEGKKFLQTMGYGGRCDISVFAADADNLLDEDVCVGRIG